MEVEIICKGDPLVIIGNIPASCGLSREKNEHEAGLQLLKHGMDYLNLPLYFIKTNCYGKPFFDNVEGPYFSISHSANFVACAISSKEIGCDIERIKRVPGNLEKELYKIQHLLDEKTTSSFEDKIKLWTVYEAMAKCIGKGIPIEQNDIDSYDWNIMIWRTCKDYITCIVTKRD